MPIKIVVRISNDNSKKKIRGDFDIYFIKVFNIKLDIDQLLYKYVINKGSSNPFIVLLDMIKIFIISERVNRTICKMIRIDKFTALFRFPSVNSYVLGNSALVILREIIISYFKSLDDEYYSIKLGEENIGTIEFVAHVRVIYIIFTVFANYKDIIKIKNHLKTRRKNYGTFNK